MQRSTHFVVAFVLSVIAANAGEVFIEAENFQSSGGWSVINGAAAKSASGLAMLNGATGDAKGTATTNVVPCPHAGSGLAAFCLRSICFFQFPKWIDSM
jgi:hypothetical protein